MNLSHNTKFCDPLIKCGSGIIENYCYAYERSFHEQLDIKQRISDIVGFSTKVTKKHVKNGTNFKN
jgi:hypothetical protein